MKFAFFVNNSPEELQIYFVGLHFDWMESDQFIGNNLSENPVIIPSLETYTFGTMAVNIPEDTTLGEHSYYVGVDGLEGESPFEWDSQNLTLVVQSSLEGEYNTLATTIQNKIDAAIDKNYQSSEAKSLLVQAQNSYSQADSLSSNNNWDAAISSLQSASNYLEQAEEKEQQYIENRGSFDPALIIIGIGVVIIVILLVIILRQKRTKIVPKETKDDDIENLAYYHVPIYYGKLFF
ncbi:MAG: hypothetical protein P8X91_03680 [Candidatus Bathyarchaeota archaeon]